ncbi:hypothetical protein OJ252_1521 [Cryptosporidium canis]|uniref:Origin recognition complex subunit 3 n=1 Tax=Cryptosporidium canis TaxID=195482 RepID=A0ABQ8PA46_9CRYT|nr:hypothetical protein OJ252_1521 [Cryptosporidium canis]
MYDKPFYISTIQGGEKNKFPDSTISDDRDTLTFLGNVRPNVFNNNDNSSTFNQAWNFFISKFLNGLKLEMSNGLNKILENIASLIYQDIDYELPIIEALSGSSNTDHFIIFNTLEEFLHSHGHKYTVFLDHEKIGLEGLTISKILDNVWLSIKNRFLNLPIEEINNVSSGELDFENDIPTRISKNTSTLSKRKDRKIIDRVDVVTEKCCGYKFKANSAPLEIESHEFYIQSSHRLLNLKVELSHDKTPRPHLSKNNNTHRGLNITKGFKLLGSIFKAAKKYHLNFNPIIILFPSVECLAPGQLGQFLEIMSQLKETYKVPFVIILGISSNILYTQHVIGQSNWNKMKFVSVNLIDSKKVFFRSIINSLLCLDDFTSNFLLKGGFKALEDMDLQETLELNGSSDDIENSEPDAFPFKILSTECIIQLKDHFFQYDCCLTFSLKTIFVMLQLYLKNNSLDIFFRTSTDINPENLVKNKYLFDQLKLKYQINKKKLPDLYDGLKEGALAELDELRSNINIINLGLCILNITFLELLNMFDLNERYNLIFEWVEAIEKNDMHQLKKKISNLALTIKNIKPNTSIFSKMNNITEIFFIRNMKSFKEKSQILGMKFVWNINTFESNIHRLFASRFDSPTSPGYILDNIFHSFINARTNTIRKQLDYHLDEMLMPNFIQNTIDCNINNEYSISDDFSLVYKIYCANKGSKINLFKLFATFCSKVIDNFNQNSAIPTDSRKHEEIDDKRLLDFLPDPYNNLFCRFVRVINTFQLIGLLYLPQRNTKNEQENIFRMNSNRSKGHSMENEYSIKYADHHLKLLLNNIYAHKLYWGNSIEASEMFCNTREVTPESHIFNIENIELSKSSTNTNITSNNKCRNSAPCVKADNLNNIRKSKKTKLEILKLRAAELNQKKIATFKSVRAQRAVNSADKIRNLRRPNRYIK